MANEYYDHGTYPAPNTKITSAGMRAELDNVEFGFDKLPPLTGNGGKKVKVKADETGLEAVVDAQTAAGTSFAATGGISSTNVQDAIAELDTEKAAAGHSHAASAVSFTPVGTISATNAQAAIAHLEDMKQAAQNVLGIVKSVGTTRSAAVVNVDYQAPIGTISGIAKGDGANALIAAVAGTDYQAPIGTISGIAKGDGANALIAAVAGTDYLAPAAIGSTVQGYDANTVKKNVASVFTAQQTPMNGSLTDGANIDWNGNTNGQVVAVTLAGNRTMNAPTNIVQNTMYLMRVSQDATGSRTLTWNAAYKFGTAGAPTLTTAASKTDWLSFVGGAGNTLEYLGIRKDAV